MTMPPEGEKTLPPNAGKATNAKNTPEVQSLSCRLDKEAIHVIRSVSDKMATQRNSIKR
jgi:hypothetical protein